MEYKIVQYVCLTFFFTKMKKTHSLKKFEKYIGSGYVVIYLIFFGNMKWLLHVVKKSENLFSFFYKNKKSSRFL